MPPKQHHIEMYEAFKGAIATHFDEQGNIIAETAAAALQPLQESYGQRYSPEEAHLLGRAAIRDMARTAQAVVTLRDMCPGVSAAGLDDLLRATRGLV